MSAAADHAATVRDLRRSIISDLIAVKGHLDTPYSDDPRWTPWTRFVERALRHVDTLAERATELEREREGYKRDFLTARERSEAAEARAVRAETALRYYADPSSWRQLETMGTSSANLDRGMKARTALGETAP